MKDYNRYPPGLRVTTCVYALLASVAALLQPLVFDAVFGESAGIPWVLVLRGVWFAALVALATPRVKALLGLPAVFCAVDAGSALSQAVSELQRMREIDPDVRVGMDASGWAWLVLPIAAYVIVAVALGFVMFGSRRVKTVAFAAVVAAFALYAIPMVVELVRWGFEPRGFAMFFDRLFDVMLLCAHIWLAAMLWRERPEADTQNTNTQTEVK